MKRATLRHDDKREIILALLEERPYKAGELVALLGIPNGVLAQVCKRMARERLLKRIPPSGAWALTAYVVPPPAPTPLRQPHERPPAVTVKPTDAPSWWVGLSREDLERQAHARSEGMRSSREYHQLPPRWLQ